MRLALIIRLTIGKAYYENTFRVFHHSLVNYFVSNRASYITGVTTNVAGGKSRG